MRKQNRVVYSVILVCFFLWIMGLSGCSKDSEVTDCKGRAIKLSQFHGKWLLVNYWATWCQPCLTELPALNQFYKRHENKIVVLGVNFDELDNEEIHQYAVHMGIDFPMLQKFPKEKYGVHAIGALPQSLLISPQGKLVKILYGPQTAASLSQATGIL